MNLSPTGLALLKLLEGFKAYPYNDSAGHATIGFGTLLHYGPVTEADRLTWEDGCTMELAEKMLRQEMQQIELKLRDLIRIPLNQNQYDALALFAYNEGTGRKGLGGSTLLQKLNAGDFEGAAAEFPRWNKEHRDGKLVVSKGLRARRLAERELFEAPMEGQADVLPTLRRGSTGPAVHALHVQLRALGYPIGPLAPSVFGPVTEGAVREFQASAGVPVDGVVGEVTRAALRAAIEGQEGAKPA